MLYDWCHDHNISPRVKLRPTLNEEAFSISSIELDLTFEPIHSLIRSYMPISTYYITTIDYIKFWELWLKCQVLDWMSYSRRSRFWTTKIGEYIHFRNTQHVSRLEPPSGEWQWTRWERHQKTIHQTFFWWRNEGKRMAREFIRRARKWHQYAALKSRGTRLDGEWPWRDPSMKKFGSCSWHAWVSGMRRPSLVPPTTAMLNFILIL